MERGQLAPCGNFEECAARVTETIFRFRCPVKVPVVALNKSTSRRAFTVSLAEDRQRLEGLR
jgi:hypothetical protein